MKKRVSFGCIRIRFVDTNDKAFCEPAVSPLVNLREIPKTSKFFDEFVKIMIPF